MLVLALDTATVGCTAALVEFRGADDAGTVLAAQSERMERGQSEALLPMVARVLGEAGVRPTDLGLIAVTVGPGAFTGIRIGLAAAKGLGLALGAPVAGVTTLEAVAGAVPRGSAQRILVALDSKREEFFVQLFDGASTVPTALSPPAAVSPDRLAAFVEGQGSSLGIVGDAAEAALRALRSSAVETFAIPGFELPVAAAFACLARDRHGGPQALAATPLYLRPPDVTPGPMPRTNDNRRRPPAEVAP
jgi:tRNA threonylcarbamoyladenosine biosynthesis protein TsaB